MVICLKTKLIKSLISHFDDEVGGASREQLESVIEKSFKTKTGVQLAREVVLHEHK